MARVEITDEIVERAMVEVGRLANGAMLEPPATPLVVKAPVVRAILEAALNPPPEPEIPVTQAMKAAAHFVATCGWSTFQVKGLTATQICGLYEPIYRAMAAKAPKPEWFVRSSSWNCLKCGDSNIFDIKRHVCPAKAPSTDCANTPVWAESVAVGQPLGRTDGLVALHLGGSVAFLNQKECDRLREDLIQASDRANAPRGDVPTPMGAVRSYQKHGHSHISSDGLLDVTGAYLLSPDGLKHWFGNGKLKDFEDFAARMMRFTSTALDEGHAIIDDIATGAG